MGNDIVKTNGVRKIVVNDTGKMLRKAFIWKSKELKNEEKLDSLEEKYYLNGEMGRETFEKLYLRFKAEHSEIVKELANSDSGISNLSETIEKELSTSGKWIIRTERVNSVVALIASLAQPSGEKEKGQTGVKPVCPFRRREGVNFRTISLPIY